MRMIALATLGATMVLAASPAPAQTYDPNYPFCMKVSGDPTYFECHFTSMGQCQQGLRGRSAECLANPYYANMREQSPASDRKRHPN